MLTNTWHDLEPGATTGAQVIAALGSPDREAEDVGYGPARGLRLLAYEERMASLFLRDDHLFLIVIVPRSPGPFPVELEGWLSALGNPSRILRSPRGKNHRTYVYSRAGLTATVERNEVQLVELFSPTSPDDYIRTIYREPPPFLK